MVSRTRRQAILEAVRKSPKASQASILFEIRSQGFRISNRAGRSIVNESRIEIRRGAERVNEVFNRELQAGFQDTEFVDFTIREIDLQGKAEEQVERILRDNVRNREVFINDRRYRGVRVSDFTHVVVHYRATATFTTYIQGRVYDSSRETVSGRFTTEVTAFTEELLAERIRQSATGQFTQRTAQLQGLGNNSVIQGLRVEMTDLEIEIVSLNPRGRIGSQSPSRGNFHITTI